VGWDDTDAVALVFLFSGVGRRGGERRDGRNGGLSGGGGSVLGGRENGGWVGILSLDLGLGLIGLGLDCYEMLWWVTIATGNV